MRNFEQKQILSLLTNMLVDYCRKCLDNPMIPETTLDLFRIYLTIQISNWKNICAHKNKVSPNVRCK